jgi:hypothetical protein
MPPPVTTADKSHIYNIGTRYQGTPVRRIGFPLVGPILGGKEEDEKALLAAIAGLSPAVCPVRGQTDHKKSKRSTKNPAVTAGLSRLSTGARQNFAAKRFLESSRRIVHRQVLGSVTLLTDNRVPCCHHSTESCISVICSLVLWR